MNERLRKKVLKMLGVLVTIWIVCALVMPKEQLKVVFWLTMIIGSGAVIYIVYKGKKSKTKMQVINVDPDYKSLFAQQIYYRVQERMQNKFPGASVEICPKDLQCIGNHGETVFAVVKKADNFTHMSIMLNKNGELIMNLFSLVNLDHVHHKVMDNIVPQEEDSELEDWFSRKGQQLLTELLTNMNARGYSKISINEDGDVMVREAGKNCVKDYFKEIPPKKDWTKLKELMCADGLDIQVSSKYLKFSW